MDANMVIIIAVAAAMIVFLVYCWKAQKFGEYKKISVILAVLALVRFAMNLFSSDGMLKAGVSLVVAITFIIVAIVGFVKGESK